MRHLFGLIKTGGTYNTKSAFWEILSVLPFRKILETFNMPYYAVAKGKTTGIFETWPECEAATKGYKYAKYKKFDNRQDAENFIKMFRGDAIESTSVKKLPNIIENYDRAFDDQLLINHLEAIDQITESYKTKLREEYNILTSTITQRSNASTSSDVSLKRKYSTTSDPSEPDVKLFKSQSFEKGENSVEFSVDDNGFVHVYTDGACENNGKWNAKAGLGVWFGPNHPLNVSEPVRGKATNNAGEIQACIKAINIAYNHGVRKLCINTDSQFVINAMTTWLPGWKKKNWVLAGGGPVKNKEDFRTLDAAVKLLTELKWNYVKAHAGIDGNEGADKLAGQGAARYGKK